MFDSISVVNLSKRVTPRDAKAMCDAVAVQLRDFSRRWLRLPVPVLFFSNPVLAPKGRPVISLLDAPDEPDALGYHWEDQSGVYLGRVFVQPVLDNEGSILGVPTRLHLPSVSSVLSHEALELVGDPTCGAWYDGLPVEQGSEYAAEVCDPVEGDSYSVGAVQVSNFVLPSWFDAGGKGPFDLLGWLSRPFSLSAGGYMVVRKGPGQEAQVFGEKVPTWRREQKGKAVRWAMRRAAPGTVPAKEPASNLVPDLEELAARMFAAYNRQAGGVTWDGKPIPPWSEVGDKVRANWRAAAEASVGRPAAKL